MADLLSFNHVGPDSEQDPDQILRCAIGRYDRLVLVGFKEGEPFVSSTHGLAEANLMLDAGKLHLLLEREA